MLIFESLPYSKEISKTFYWILVALLITYVPGFYTMYTHMIVQRSRTLGKGKVKKK